MQTSADLRSHYDAVRARLMGRVPSPAGTPIVPVAPVAPVAAPAAKPKRPPIIYPAKLRCYPQPIGPKQPAGRGITLKSIIAATCAAYAMDPEDVTGPRRLAEYALPRQVAFYVARQMTGLSLTQIGAGFGGKDHTTVLHGIRKVEAMAKADADMHARIAAIIQVVDQRLRHIDRGAFVDRQMTAYRRDTLDLASILNCTEAEAWNLRAEMDGRRRA